MANHYPLANDRRYSVALEYCGHAEKRHVLRYCGEFIESFTSYPAAVLRAAGHKAVLNGAPVFINQPVEG